MKSVRWFVCLLGFTAWWLGAAYAGGTMGTDEVIPLLKQQPALYEHLSTTLEFSSAAWAQRIGHVGRDRLAGARVAPYEFNARRKGHRGDWEFRLIVEAETTYFDEVGRKVTHFDGVRFEEKLIGVRIELLESETPPSEDSPKK